MTLEHWYVLAGCVLLAMAVLATRIERWPLTQAIIFLGIGLLIGPAVAGWLRVDAVSSAHLVERVTEAGVVVSLFAAGLKLGVPLADDRWRLPVRLASASMLVTVGLIAVVGRYALGLPWGAAVLLGGILAPTDPVLAGDVQVEDHSDRDRLRFGLTGEAGLNDGTAFPFVMLGLGMLGLRDLGAFGWRWVAVDVLWAIAGGLAIGAVFGALVGKLIVYLRSRHREAVGTDDYLSIGLLALAYGTAVSAHAYGFLAAFAAGLALRRVEVRGDAAGAAGEPTPEQPAATSGPNDAAATPGDADAASPDAASHDAAPADAASDTTASPEAARGAPADDPAGQSPATHPARAGAHMTRAVLGFNEQLGRIAEVSLVILIGAMLAPAQLTWVGLWFVPLLLLVIRPVGVYVGTAGLRATGLQRQLIAWFGIRGIGSIYYLAYATNHGLPADLAQTLTAIVFTTVAASIAIHGISVTPLMNLYRHARGRRRPGPARAEGDVDDKAEAATG